MITETTARAAQVLDLDKIPTDDPIRVLRAEDGTVTVIREKDAAIWNGEEFVVTEPAIDIYAVVVHMPAVDSLSAQKAVRDALDAAAVEGFAIEDYVAMLEERHKEVDKQIRAEIAPGIRFDEASKIHKVISKELADFLGAVVAQLGADAVEPT